MTFSIVILTLIVFFGRFYFILNLECGNWKPFQFKKKNKKIWDCCNTVF